MAHKELQDGRHIPLESTAREIARGTNRKAELIDVQVVAGMRKRVERMVRKVPLGNFSVELVEQELRVHEELMKHDIPAIPTFRQDPQNPTHVYCTDISMDGKRYVFSKNNWKDLAGKMSPPSNSEELLQEIIQLAKKCAESGLKIHRAAFLFFVDKGTHEASVLIGDYKQVEIKNHLPGWQLRNVERLRENLAAASRSLEFTGALLGLSKHQYEPAFGRAVEEFSKSS
ncbi:hypothetical protein EXS70_01455 [Candidatus Peribacteria bacterium]|nr:hypothetical protein [Candidatus Peribacteria bacterium]